MLDIDRAFSARCLCIALLGTLPVLGGAAEMPAEPIPSSVPLDTVAPDDTTSIVPETVPVSHAVEGARQGELPAVEVADASRSLTIAMLMPKDGSPFMSAAKIIGSGLMAASSTSAKPASILQIEAAPESSVMDQVYAAVASGADVVVGPVERNAVEELSRAASLPIPIVALNALPADSSAYNLIGTSISADSEARYIAELAIRALPSFSDRYGFPKVLVLTSGGMWEQRIAAAYEEVLKANYVDFIAIDTEKATPEELQKQLEAKLDDDEEAVFAERRAEAKEALADEPLKLKRRLKAIDQERRAKIAVTEPPFQAALLALDAQKASLVRNRLPRGMRVWATSASNPGDPSTSSASAALTYDLEDVVFAECPLVVRYDAQGFEARFETTMPYSLPAKRLFALGADAYELAQQWSTHRQLIQYHGQTGFLELDRTASPAVKRTPQTVVIQSGRLFEVKPELAAKTVLARIKLPEKKELPHYEVIDSFSNIRRTSVRSIIIKPDSITPLPPPTPMLPPSPREQASEPAPSPLLPSDAESLPLEAQHPTAADDSTINDASAPGAPADDAAPAAQSFEGSGVSEDAPAESTPSPEDALDDGALQAPAAAFGEQAAAEPTGEANASDRPVEAVPPSADPVPQAEMLPREEDADRP